MLPLLLLLPALLQAQQYGLAIVGGQSTVRQSEFFVPFPEELHCSLPSATRTLYHPTLSTWQDTLIVCDDDSCDQLTPSGWQHWRNTLYNRGGHTSAVTSQGLLLVGGDRYGNTTELLPWDGGDSREGFTLQHQRRDHCSIQTSPDTIVLTGGSSMGLPNTMVTEYSGLDAGEVTARELPPLLVARSYHACGWYTERFTQAQVLMVTGGYGYNDLISTTELFTYTGQGAGSWRVGGRLPSARSGLSLGKVDGLLFAVGGFDASDYGSNGMAEILFWYADSPVDEERWTGWYGSMLETANYYQGVTEVSLAAVADYCN